MAALLIFAFPILVLAQDDSAEYDAQQPGVEEVGVHLELTGGYVGGETMAQLEQALLQVTEVAIMDQLDGSLAYIANNKEQVEGSLSTVIGSVLAKRGFTLEGLSLEPGVRTKLTVQLRLNEARVDSFEVRFILLGNTPVIETVVAEDEEAIAAELHSTVARTPYGDSNWLAGLVGDAVEAKLAEMPAYAGFEQLVLVQPGPTTKVAVTFTPQDDEELVCEYEMVARSKTLLDATLGPVRDEAQFYLRSLVGAPHSFINAKLFEIESALFQYLVNCGALSGLCADAGLSLELCECKLQARIDVESEQYVIALQGRIDLWKHDDGTRNARLSVLAGVQPTPGWMLYSDWDYFPGSGEVYPMLGAGKLLPRGSVGAGWDFKARAWRLQGEHELSDDMAIQADFYTGGEDTDALSEIALKYRLHNAYELQLIGNMNGEVFAALAANL